VSSSSARERVGAIFAEPTSKGRFYRATQISGVAVGAASFLLAALVGYEVASRALYGATAAWVNDISVYLMGFITFVGAAYALAEGAHVRVDIVLTKVGRRTQILLELIADLFILAVVATLTSLSGSFWWDAYVSGERSWGLFGISLWVPYSFLAFGMAWLLAMHLAIMFHHWRSGVT
jgi:TRAP-type C4-dicarboxylate transport system permease small subunit